MDNNFKDIKDFEGKYKINKQGIVINAITGYQLSQYISEPNPNITVSLHNKGKVMTRYVYKLVNATFNLNLTNNDIMEYYQKNKINKDKKNQSFFGPTSKQLYLLFKNGTRKRFYSLSSASTYLNKNSNYLSFYLNKHNNDPFVIVKNKFICYIDFINSDNINEEDFNIDNNLNEPEKDNLEEDNNDLNYDLPDDFKEIPGYENLYAINKHGEIKKVRGLSSVETFVIHCEQHANLFKAGKNKTFRIADLVGYTFIQNNSNYKFINKDGDTNNNNVDNLVMEKIVIDNSRAKKKNKLILKDGTVKYFDTLMAASRFLGKSTSYLSFYLANHHTHDIVTAEKGFVGRIEFKK